MKNIDFINPNLVHLIWPLILFIIIILALALRNKDKLNNFISPKMQQSLVILPSNTRKTLKFTAMTFFFIALILAAMRPYTTQTQTIAATKNTANIMILLDLSKSMLATDVAPNRLGRAKAEIRDFLPTFKNDRLALMGFAGKPALLTPLTTDHGFFRLVLENASPALMQIGGTKIGDAIRKANTLLKDQEGPKVILLISDGEDHDSYPLEAAQESRQLGITIIAVGFGDEKGTVLDIVDPITSATTRIKDPNGKDVISKLDGETLRKMATETKGVYIPAATAVLDLDAIMKKHVVPLIDPPTQLKDKTIKVELFQIPLFIAIIALLGMILAQTPINNKKIIP